MPGIQEPGRSETLYRAEVFVKGRIQNYLETFNPGHIDRTSQVALEYVVVVFDVACCIRAHHGRVYAVFNIRSRQPIRPVCRKIGLTPDQHPEDLVRSYGREVPVLLPS